MSKRSALAPFIAAKAYDRIGYEQIGRPLQTGKAVVRELSLSPLQLPGENVWYVDVKFQDGRREQVGVFDTNSETRNWIKQKSSVWIRDYECRTSNWQHD